MSVWEFKIGNWRPIYWLGLNYLRYAPGVWLKEYLRHGVVGHSPRHSEFTNCDGIHFNLDLFDCVQKAIFCFHYYEPEDVEAFRRFARPGSVVFDVGANVGQYSLLASKLVGETGHVYAFEPSPDVLVKLQHHLEVNHADNVLLTRKAVAECNGTASFYPANENSNQGVGSLLPAEEYRGKIRTEESIEVEVVTLDNFCEEHGIDHIDLLKIDVEGYDLDVLKGAEKILDRSPGIVVLAEVEPMNLVQRGLTHADFVQYMTERGFKAYYANIKGRLIALVDDDASKPNLFFLRS